jgi:hypothetical protein
MVQAGMYSPGIDQVGESHLVDAPQPLIPGMGDDPQQEGIVEGNKSMHGVIDDLAGRLGHSCFDFVKTSGKNGQIYKQHRTLYIK